MLVSLSALTAQAKSCGDAELEDNLEVRLRLIELQQRLAAAVEAAPTVKPLPPSPHYILWVWLSSACVRGRRASFAYPEHVAPSRFV